MRPPANCILWSALQKPVKDAHPPEIFLRFQQSDYSQQRRHSSPQEEHFKEFYGSLTGFGPVPPLALRMRVKFGKPLKSVDPEGKTALKIVRSRHLRYHCDTKNCIALSATPSWLKNTDQLILKTNIRIGEARTIDFCSSSNGRAGNRFVQHPSNSFFVERKRRSCCPPPHPHIVTAITAEPTTLFDGSDVLIACLDDADEGPDLEQDVHSGNPLVMNGQANTI